MHSTTPLRAAATIIAACVLCVLLVRYASVLPAVVPASAPATEFSAERALAHVRAIAQRPHPIGSADNARVREYVIAQIRLLGLEPQVQEATGVGTRYPEAGYVRNVLARLPGRTPGGQAVVLMSHYDGVAGGPAAGDDAAGTAAVLETLRALRAGPPLAHDIMVVITDGEEAGLLGAAAFVREHPWAKDVGVTLNFEARGTAGRSYMFETGRGNLDVARVFRQAGDVSATSLSVTVYRSLPNDTDLSEMAVLGKPALNFAFADGVERYHTAHDDVEHLNPGSLQHHGSQMLAMARAFGDGPLPRPVTGDAVFSDMPLVGLIVYPESWALPIAIVGLVLVVVAAARLARDQANWMRDILLGTLGTIVAACVGGGVALGAGALIVRVHDVTGWGGAPAFRGLYTAALALLALAVSAAVWALMRRWASVAGLQVGALIVWGIVALLLTLKLPGVSFLFAWPVVIGAIAALGLRLTPLGTRDRLTPTPTSDALTWIATAIGAALVVPFIYAISTVLLGAAGPGGIATGTMVPLLTWLLAPQLEAIGARRWITAGAAFVLAVIVIVVGMMTIRSSPEHPTPSVLVYAVDADSGGAWLAVRGPTSNEIVKSASAQSPPVWLARLFGGPSRNVAFESVPRVTVAPPTATVIGDSTVGGTRRVTLRIAPAPGTETITMQAKETEILGASIAGRPIDTSRYRGRVRPWRLEFSAPPDSGITLLLAVFPGTPVSLDLLARSPGLPTLDSVRIPPRGPDVVTIQTGDVTLAHRAVYIR
jgi:peptidase M28-like protein